MTPNPELALRDISLADLAKLTNGTLVGPDCPIRFFGFLGSAEPAEDTLTFTTSPEFVQRFVASPMAAAIVSRDAELDIDPESRSVILHDKPAEAFWSLHVELARTGRHGSLEGRRSPDATVAPSARVDDHVRIGAGVTIGDGAYVGKNVVVDDLVTIGPGAVIGTDGFQASVVDGRRQIMPHVGGVHIQTGAHVGALSAVDSALFGTFTSIGAETMIDNHVQIGHNVVTGGRCTIAAMTEVSGHVHLGDDVWIAPGCSMLQFVSIGRGALVAVGSVLARDVPAHTKVSGNPARPIGRVCLCRHSIDIEGDRGVCTGCGREYALDGGDLTLVE